MLPHKFSKRLMLIASLVALQACVPAAVVGVGAVAAKVATDPRTTGTQVDDQTLEFRVSSAIDKDPQVKQDARINVVVYDSRALLIGQAPNESISETAKSLAEGVEHITEVYNQVRVAPQINIAQISKDSWITGQVKSKLFISSNVKSTDVKVVTENGEVFLIGNLTRSQADAAARVASEIDGVRRVVKVINYLN